MSTGAPDVSVVVATHDRPELLAELCAALRDQTLAHDRFEVVVVDDASGPATQSVLVDELQRDGLNLRVVRREHNAGAAAARNAGWRAATAELVAFTDDDCAPSRGWLEAGLSAWGGRPDRFVQGATRPAGGLSMLDLDPFAHAVEVSQLTPEAETCNIFYPRTLLERLGGFEESMRAGEDMELAWSARETGAQQVFAPDALVEHAVISVDMLGSLRRVWRWSDAMRPFAGHPELRRTRLIRGVFWNWSHYLIVRALLALPLVRRPLGRLLAIWLAWPLVRFELERSRRAGNVRLAPLWFLRDLVELAAVLRGAIRYRTLVI